MLKRSSPSYYDTTIHEPSFTSAIRDLTVQFRDFHTGKPVLWLLNICGLE